jgi:hypothetical protein
MIEKQKMRMLMFTYNFLLLPLTYSSYVPCILLVVECLPYLWTSLAEGSAYQWLSILARYRILGLSAEGREISPILGHRCPSK